MRSKKRPAQLDREIAAALKQSPRYHATQRDAWEPFARPNWDVVLDALLQLEPKKAAEVWHQMLKEEGASPRPASFVRGLRDVPMDVRVKFEDLTARTSDRYIEAINDALYQTKDPDALIAAVKAANKHVATKQDDDDSRYDLVNLLVKAKEMVRRIKIQRKTGSFPKPSRRTAWKLRA